MKPALLLVLVWSLTLFAGCHALDDEGDAADPTPTTSPTTTTTPTNTTDPDPSPTPDPTDDPEIDVIVSILNHTTEVNVSEDIEVNWRVETVPASAIDMTEVLFANATFTTNDTSNATSAGKQENVPGAANFSATFKATEAGNVFIRAHAVVDGQHHYTDLVEVTVKTAGAVGGTTHQVIIGKRVIAVAGTEVTQQGQGSNSFFEPPSRTIKKGDLVVWKNEDASQLPHSAIDCPNPTGTSSCTETPRWQTPNIAGGKASQPLQFNTLGTYNYYCGVHPDSPTMGKPAATQYRIIVQV